MNGLFIVIKYMFRRMIRDVPSTILVLFMPLLLIPILGSVFGWIPMDIPYLRGVTNVMAFFAFGMLIMFQLYGGGFSLNYVKHSMLTPMKWRMHALPCAPAVIVVGVVAAATIVCIGQGLLVVAATRLALGVRWGNILVVFLVLLGVSLVSQFVNLAILLAVRNPGAASGIAWIYAYGSCVLGGLIFPLPVEKPFFRFMVDYGTPYSLAQTAMRESAAGGSTVTIAVCISALFLAAALFAGITAVLGRRRLA